MIAELPFTLPDLRAAYGGGLRPEDVIEEVFARLAAAEDDAIFLHADRDGAVAQARALGAPDDRALWGIPFAVKDNIDVAGLPTTAACPDAAYTADRDAAVVARLRAAGAIVIGKTNLDQFATGLVGTRTPYPVPRNALDPAIVPGGSSSGSAVAVARGIVPFSLGTDTAGSGRVPAALNGIVGLKPTLGAWSTTGLVPACRTLDTLSVFAMTVEDAFAVHRVATGFDAADGYSRKIAAGRIGAVPDRLRVAIPTSASLQTFGDTAQVAAFHAAADALRAKGATIDAIDLTPFFETALMLYEGAWVAERAAALGARLTDAPDTLHPVTRRIIEPGLGKTAVETFQGLYRLADLRRRCETALAGADLLCVPTIPCFVSLAEDAADPVGFNARLGTYTNFVNLLDLCGMAVPVGLRTDGRPASVTLLARAARDALVASTARLIEDGPMGATAWPRPAPPTPSRDPEEGEIALAVCGAHMTGLPLNHQLTDLDGRFLRACRTAPDYRLYALPDGRRPGLIRVATGGAPIELEIWALPTEAVGSFLAGIAPPLGLGTVALEDGGAVKGFLCEQAGTEGAVDITATGGWRRHIAGT